MEFNFKGKRALVTGAGRGIGRAIAIALVKYGAETIALSKSKEPLDSLVKECPGIVAVSVDLEDWAATREVMLTLGPIHLLVNNAGFSKDESFVDISPDTYDKVMNVNLKAVINVSQVVVKGMIERGEGGAVVNMSSQASQVALKGHSVYSASKAALDSLTGTMALELGPHQIRVNAVNPTVVLTDMALQSWSDPTKAQGMLNRIPLGRFAEVEDVVGPVLFLLSDSARMIHGTTLPIDGGLLAA